MKRGAKTCGVSGSAPPNVLTPGALKPTLRVTSNHVGSRLDGRPADCKQGARARDHDRPLEGRTFPFQSQRVGRAGLIVQSPSGGWSDGHDAGEAGIWQRLSVRAEGADAARPTGTFLGTDLLSRGQYALGCLRGLSSGERRWRRYGRPYRGQRVYG